MSITRLNPYSRATLDRLSGVGPITKIGSVVAAGGISNSTRTLATPVTTAIGDLVLWHGISGGGAATAPTSAAAGMTMVAIKAVTGVSVGRSHYIYYGWSTANGSYNVSQSWGTTTDGGAQLVVYRGVDVVTVLDSCGTGEGSLASDTSHTIPEYTTQDNGSLAFIAHISADDNAPTQGASSWTSLHSMDVGTTTSATLLSKEMPTAGATGDAIVTLTANGPDTGMYFQFALRLLAP